MRRILLLFLLMASSQLRAQQNAHYTQYIFNGLVINPAYAGSKEVLHVSGMYRSQWAGLEGAPTTQTLSLDGAVLKKKVGLGLHVLNDQLGAQGQKSFYGSTAFRVSLGPAARLALGLAGGASEYYTDGSKLQPIDKINDAYIPTTREGYWLPDAKAGLFFNTERYFMGLSASNLIGFRNKFLVTPTRHYYFTTGYVFDLNETLRFKPSILLKEDFKSPTNLDLNAFLLVGDRLWLGGSYRTGVKLYNQAAYEGEEELGTNNAWAMIAELYLSPRIKVGYSYDVTLTSLRGYASHEVSLGFYFYKKEEAKSLTIRYF
jgi:type IX secretion system PorP/SprF family membrane protein